MMSITADKDILDRKSWKKHTKPVFVSKPEA